MRRWFSMPAAMLSMLLTAALEPAMQPSAIGPALNSSKAQDEPATHLVEQAPVAISEVAPGVFLVDFGHFWGFLAKLTDLVRIILLAEMVFARFGDFFW